MGGRLVISGVTVVVTANPDLPPRDSSIGTKTDTPLIETPRSVSITYLGPELPKDQQALYAGVAFGETTPNPQAEAESVAAR